MQKMMKIMSILQATILLVLMTAAEDDTLCLKEFKQSVKDPNNYLGTWDFSINGSTCSFVGVQCWNNLENKVLSLTLEQAGLSGPFPSGLNTCLSITALSLARNAFSRSIPANICDQMSYLTILDLSANRFNGSIPLNLAQCLYLNKLHLEENQLSGSIPGAIRLLPRLTDLNLSSNSLNGSIPTSFTNRSLIGQLPDPASAFQNNSGLCGPPLPNPCNSR